MVNNLYIIMRHKEKIRLFKYIIICINIIYKFNVINTNIYKYYNKLIIIIIIIKF